MYYIIYDAITSECLSRFSFEDPEEMSWNGFLRPGENSKGECCHFLEYFEKSGKFKSLKDAKKAKEIIEKIFLKNEEEIDFKIFSVKDIKNIIVEIISEIKEVE